MIDHFKRPARFQARLLLGSKYVLFAALYHITYTASGAHIFPATPRDSKQFKNKQVGGRRERKIGYRV